MLRQEMESCPIIIGACAQNKDDKKKVKTHVGKYGDRMVHKSTYSWDGCYGSSSEYQRGLFLRSLTALKPENTWQACITFHNFLKA